MRFISVSIDAGTSTCDKCVHGEPYTLYDMATGEVSEHRWGCNIFGDSTLHRIGRPPDRLEACMGAEFIPNL
jgi:hypothetical protein